MAETLTFYTNPMSRGRIVRWMLEEVGQPYDTVVVPFGPAMKAPEYLAVNPMGKVPALRHGDRIVTECGAICTWLADAFPQAGLMPEDRGLFYRWMFFGAGPLEYAIVNRSLGWEVPPDKTSRIGYGTYGTMVDVLEQGVARHPYLCGETFSGADVYVGSQIAFGMQFGTLPDRPAFRDYAARITDRPAAVRARALDDALMPKEHDHG
jgi:glutathione S-transferase